jgi:hypothetical protein
LDHILDLTDAAQGNFRGYLAGQCDSFILVHRAAIILLATRNNVPAVYQNSFFVRDAPQQAAVPVGQGRFRVGPARDSCTAANGPLVRYQISGKPRRSPFPCILGRDRLPLRRLEV